MKRVVVDVDVGTDDAVALLLLLTLEPQKDYQIVGVTCTHGNTTVDNVCRNVLTTLHFIHRLDVPVFRGAEGPLIPLQDSNVIFEDFHGKNGIGDKNFPLPQKSIQSENAVAALNRLAKEEEGSGSTGQLYNIWKISGIVLICLAPLTNVALALRTYSEFSKNLREVYIMGGNVKGIGNCTASAEFNFFKDPEAAHIVLSSLTCPVTLFPWETCLEPCLTLEERFKDIGSIPRAHVEFLNEIETDQYKKEKFWMPCDAMLTATFLDKRIIKKSREMHLSVELHGLFTRGQCVVDNSKKSNVRVVEEMDLIVFKKLIVEMASYVPGNK